MLYSKEISVFGVIWANIFHKLINHLVQSLILLLHFLHFISIITFELLSFMLVLLNTFVQLIDQFCFTFTMLKQLIKVLFALFKHLFQARDIIFKHLYLLFIKLEPLILLITTHAFFTWYITLLISSRITSFFHF